MSQLGIMMGHCLQCLINHDEFHTVIYASHFGESRALEDYLLSFPDASPTGFQSSIHPSGIQQGLIARKRPISSLFPLAGGQGIVGQSLLTALLSPEPKTIFCGGEEKGTWLAEVNCASDAGFAFAINMIREQEGNQPTPCIATLELSCDDTIASNLALGDFFNLLHNRTNYNGPVACGWQISLTWKQAD